MPSEYQYRAYHPKRQYHIHIHVPTASGHLQPIHLEAGTLQCLERLTFPGAFEAFI